jgi:hypothetical protein
MIDTVVHHSGPRATASRVDPSQVCNMRLPLTHRRCADRPRHFFVVEPCYLHSSNCFRASTACMRASFPHQTNGSRKLSAHPPLAANGLTPQTAMSRLGPLQRELLEPGRSADTSCSQAIHTVGVPVVSRHWPLAPTTPAATAWFGKQSALVHQVAGLTPLTLGRTDLATHSYLSRLGEVLASHSSR